MFQVQDGFVIGARWPEGENQVWIPVSNIDHIDIDAGNSPPADRVYLRDARGHIDLLRRD